jgi:hypothetical protein
VSREWSKRRGTHARNQLALNLKAIIVGCSPKLANDERAAEDWAAFALDTAGIRCPDRHTNPPAFKGMFARWRPKSLIRNLQFWSQFGTTNASLRSDAGIKR